jgi:hypothetical protein
LTHLDIASRLGIALQNHDLNAANRLKNAVSQALGYPAVPNFDAAKQIVADEIAKAVIGGQMGEGDRERLQHTLDNASSPQQIAGVIDVLKQLMAGQLEGFRRQFTTTTGQTEGDFNKELSPEAQRELEGRGAAPGPGGAAPPREQMPSFKSSAEVVQAYKAGKITRDQAAQILRQNGWAQ